ncbi:MAG: cell surface protein SprA [Microscillaceae bacterium]|nr:cell surface protein SprA [Microscillaceae bacterium]
MLSFKNILAIGLSLSLVWLALPWRTAHSDFYGQIPFPKPAMAKDSVSGNTSINLVADSIRAFVDSLVQDKLVRLDTPVPYKPSRFPTYSPQDRYSDPFSSRRLRGNMIYDFPNLIKTDITFDTDSTNRRYLIDEKLGSRDFRAPTFFTDREMDEFSREQAQKDIMQELAGGKTAETATSGKGLIPRIPVESPWFERIFGGNFVEFKPVGFVNLDFSLQRQKVANPNLPIRQQRLTNFNFDPHANLTVTGKVGNKLQISGSFDTKASFQFENNFKLEYRGFEEDIIRKIEFGNVSFPLSTTLIQGAQNLFGVSTELQFGKLRMRSVFSNQRARADQVRLQGGAQRRNFEIVAGDYEDNRHFFLSQFFRQHYEEWLRELPQITSGMQITRIEVYVTNRVNNTQDLRNIAAYLDLGEAKPLVDRFQNSFSGARADSVPRNNVNQLFEKVQNILNADNATNELINAQGLRNGTDFTVLRAARKLNPREFTFHPQLGYISLLTPLRNDEVLAVAFEYTINGRNFKVGELTDDYATRNPEQLIHLKMLRPPSIRLDLPTWDLMMKNVYSLNATQINRQNFLLRIIYKDDLTGIDNPTLQEGVRVKDRPLLRVMGLDRLNPQNDPQPDGNFDYVEGLTIDSRNGKIYFPVLEPFGANLRGTPNFANEPRQLKFDPVNEVDLINKYVFDRLYRSTKADALQTADKNKFFIQGSFEGAAANDVSLQGINIPEGSVRVTAGGIPLVEGVQYTVDYVTGKVQIIDESVINSGQEIKIDYEKSDLFNFQVRRFLGTRFDYVFNPHLNIGATLMSLRERPVITRVNINEDPVNNTMLGLDVNYQSKSRLLTRLVDALPLVQTKAESDISFYAEYAQLFPAGSKVSGQVSLIDDFEGTRTVFSLTRSPQVNWKLGATPQLYPEANLINDRRYGHRRAKLAWYNVDNLFYRGTGPNLPPNIDLDNHYSRLVRPQEIFPAQNVFQVQTNEIVMDLAYFPEERGPYNYNPNLTSEGLLPNPQQNFGAITRAITSDIDFDNANVEYLEFWMLDPFIQGRNGRILDGRFNQNNTQGGDLYLNLGTISEDILPDGRHAFENGLPVTGASPDNLNGTSRSSWGLVTNQQYLTNAFDNSPAARPNQDVGLDGLRSTDEAIYDTLQTYANAVQTRVTNPLARQNILNDLSGDDFSYYLGAEKDGANMQIIERYKNFNGLENNSPAVGTAGGFTPSATNLPDNEDLNIDNTLNSLDGYYQYKIPLRPNQLRVGNGFIIDQVTTDVTLQSGTRENVNWYLFRIPIRQFDQKIGNIEGFKSIRFLRLFLTNFSQPVVLRMARMQMVASQWRRYLQDLTDRSLSLPIEPYDAKFNVSVVNIEENSTVETGSTPYTLPPGVIRDRDVTNVNFNRVLNEQSMRLCVTDLRDRDARAVFRNYNMDFLSYKRVRMYIHAESDNAQDNEVTALVRLGTDFTDNYYEIEVPLKLTPRGTTDPAIIWPTENEIDVQFTDLTDTKVARNLAGLNRVVPFSQFVGKYRITVVGNPDLSAVLVAMIGIRNPNLQDFGRSDDRLPKSMCIWVNEFRITDFDQTPGWAALGRTNIRLADLANIAASASHTTFGFGSINQRISERTRKNTTTFNVQATLALDKFLPEKWGFKIPMLVDYEWRNVSPRFNPLDPDVKLENSLRAIGNETQRQEYSRIVEENFTRRSINFTNVRKIKTNPNAKVNLWDFENFAFTWAYSEENRTDINTAEFRNINQRWGLAYTYAKEVKAFEPFKNLKFLDKPYLKFIKDFNFSPLPGSISVRADLDRKFTKTLFRAADRTTNGVEPLFQKIFTFTRAYALQWNFTKSLNLNYNANAFAVVDEPAGDLDTREKRDSLLNNLKRLGRMKNFTQQIALTYRLPLDKFPIIDWLSADLGYNANYNWNAGAISFIPGDENSLANRFGNTATNARDRTVRGGLDMSKLYRKSKFLGEAETWTPPQKKDKDKEKDAKNKKNPPKPEKKDTAQVKERDWTWLKKLVKPLLMLKRINFNYALNEQTVFPGFRPTPQYFGLADLDVNSAPGLPFILGSQNALDVQRRARENNWLATDSTQSNPFTQAVRENLTLNATLEPFNEFRIQIDAKKTRQVNYQEFFRVGGSGNIENQNPLRTGSYSVSFIGIGTAFRRDNNQLNSSVFDQFANNRDVIRQRLLAQNPNVTALDSNYAGNLQDVLIPAFLAAYGNKDAGSINLSAFPRIPLPNWQIDYSGLSKLPFMQSILSSFTLRHSYSGEYRVNNYTSSLDYGSGFLGLNSSELDYSFPNRKNAQNQFIPIYVIGQVVISERFNPVLGINLRTKSNLTLRLDYNKERDLTLNLSNAQIAEINNQSIVVSVGFTKANMKLPFKSGGKAVILKNDVDMRLDVTFRDTRTIQRQLDAEIEGVATGGNLNFQIRPVISYVVNQQLNLQFYMEQTLNDPRVSSSFRRTTTTGGVQLRYNITQ